MSKSFLLSSMLIGLFLTDYTACCNTQNIAMKKPVLPKMEIPAQAIILSENIAMNDSERSDNWRFFLRQDGCFFHARNNQLWISDPSLLLSDDPALHWNKPFPETPNRCLTASQQQELRKAINQINFASLDDYYPTPANMRVSHSSAERWTIVQNNHTHTIVVENGFAPTELKELRKTIDRLIANAPRQ